MTARQQKSWARPGLPPLAPEAAARLRAQVAQVAAALAAGQELDAIRELATPAPQDPVWDQHLMAELARLAHPALPPLLAAWFGSAQDKVRRKALKKSLHILQTRGVAVPGDLLPREEPGIGAARSGLFKAQVSALFGLGLGYVVLEGPTAILGGNLLASRISDQEGFLECHLLHLKPRQVTEFWDNFRQQGLAEWCAPPPAFAVGLLEEAYARNPQAEGASRYGALRDKICKHWGAPDQVPPLAEVLPPVDPAEVSRLLVQSRELAQQPLFQAWIPGPEEIQPWLEKLQEVRGSRLVLTEQQKQVRADAVLDEATRALYPPATRPDWRRRLLFMAYFLELTSRREEARLAQAAAADLASPERGALAGENPFLKGLVQRSLQLAWSLKKSQETPAPSGLVTPPTESLIVPR
jgi:hypothetical protein